MKKKEVSFAIKLALNVIEELLCKKSDGCHQCNRCVDRIKKKRYIA